MWPIIHKEHVKATRADWLALPHTLIISNSKHSSKTHKPAELLRFL